MSATTQTTEVLSIRLDRATINALQFIASVGGRHSHYEETLDDPESASAFARRVLTDFVDKYLDALVDMKDSGFEEDDKEFMQLIYEARKSSKHAEQAAKALEERIQVSQPGGNRTLTKGKGNR